MAGAALSAANALGAFSPLVAEAAKDDSRTHQQSRLLMGTIVTLTAASSEQGRVEAAFGNAFAEMERLITIFDRHNPATALSVLNVQGRLAGAPAELVTVLEESVRIGKATGFAFNPAVTPMVDLYESARARSLPGGKMPHFGDKDLKEALALSRPGAIRISDGAVRLERSGMRLTLDGIAKGYVADQASRILTENGVADHMVNAGGDIRVSGHAASGKPWTVGVQHPLKAGALLATVPLRSGAMATSGSYENYYDRARTRHHLISHLTGKSADIASVSVRAASAMQADALATALAFMPPVQAVRYVENSAAACLVVDGRGRAYRSSGWV